MTPIFKTLEILQFYQINYLEIAFFMPKSLKTSSQASVANTEIHSYSATRQSHDLYINYKKHKPNQNSVAYKGKKLWNKVLTQLNEIHYSFCNNYYYD